MARPTALGLDVSVENLADADRVLDELSWLANEQARRDAVVKQRVDELKRDALAKSVVEIDGMSLSIDDRITELTALLEAWVAAHVAEHLTGKAKSLDLTHGSVGLRQQPAVAELGAGETAQSVLDRIDETTGLVTAVKAILERNVPTLGKHVRTCDLLKITIAPAEKQMQAAHEANRLTREQLATFGVFLRAAANKPVVKPAKMVVS